jgi:predicted nucleic acid-binding protein
MTHRPYLLDTNVLLLLVRGGPQGHAIDARFRLRESVVRPCISIVTVGEIRVLAQRQSWGEARREVLERTLSAVVVVDINHPSVLDAYVEMALACDTHPSGARVMGKNDLWIAACARAADAFLLTTDKDFNHLVPSIVRGEVIPPPKAGHS